MNFIDIRFKNAAYSISRVIADETVAVATFNVLKQALSTGQPCYITVDGSDNVIQGSELAAVSYTPAAVVKARQDRAEAERRAYEAANPTTAPMCGPVHPCGSLIG